MMTVQFGRIRRIDTIFRIRKTLMRIYCSNLPRELLQ